MIIIFVITAALALFGKIFNRQLMLPLLGSYGVMMFLKLIYSLFFGSLEKVTSPVMIVVHCIIIACIGIAGLVMFFVFRKMVRKPEYREKVLKSVSTFFQPFSKEKAIEPPQSEDSFVIHLENGSPLILNNIFNGVMITGQPGSGKTASVIHKILHQVVKKDWTGLIYDLKGKLGDEVASILALLPEKAVRTTEVRFINFSNPLKSHRVNPVNPIYMSNKAEALEFVGTLLENLMATNGSKGGEDPFWFNNAKNILTAIIWFLRNNHPKMCTLPHAIALTYWKSPEDLIDLLQSDNESARMLSTLRASADSKDKKLFINILSTLYTHLMSLDLPELFFVLTGNEVNLNVNSHERPTLLTIANHEPLQKVYSPIIAVICNVVTQRMNEEGKRKGVIMFDEFASIKIPNFERIPETIRSRGVATIIALHDKQQLITRYGESIAETIASTLVTKFYFKSTNFKTVDEAIKILGKRDVKFNTASKSKSTSTIITPITNTSGQAESVQERDFLKVEELTNYDRGEFAGIFSDANLKYTKGQRVKLEFLPSYTSVDLRTDFKLEDIENNYKQVYMDIELMFAKRNQSQTTNTEDIKIDFDS